MNEILELMIQVSAAFLTMVVVQRIIIWVSICINRRLDKIVGAHLFVAGGSSVHDIWMNTCILDRSVVESTLLRMCASGTVIRSERFGRILFELAELEEASLLD